MINKIKKIKVQHLLKIVAILILVYGLYQGYSFGITFSMFEGKLEHGFNFLATLKIWLGTALLTLLIWSIAKFIDLFEKMVSSRS